MTDHSHEQEYPDVPVDAGRYIARLKKRHAAQIARVTEELSDANSEIAMLEEVRETLQQQLQGLQGVLQELATAQSLPDVDPTAELVSLTAEDEAGRDDEEPPAGQPAVVPDEPDAPAPAAAEAHLEEATV